MSSAWLGFSMLGLAGVMGCGGRAIEQPGTGGSDPSPPASTAGPSQSDPSGSFPSHELGACTPGFRRSDNPDRACHWLTEAGECFDDIDGACACVCPRDRKSVCSSDFDDGPSSATLVFCD